jgi:membrane protein DedA with SNARE-associated domain
MSMIILPFVVASFVGRGARFFLVAGLIYWGGQRFEQNLRRYVDILGWLFVGLCVVAVFVLRSK